MIPTMIGTAIGIAAGASIDLIAEPVTMSTGAISGRSVRSMHSRVLAELRSVSLGPS